MDGEADAFEVTDSWLYDRTEVATREEAELIADMERYYAGPHVRVWIEEVTYEQEEDGKDNDLVPGVEL